MPFAMKALALAGVAPLLASANVPTSFPSPYTASFAPIPRLDCGTGSGTGVRIDDSTIITATHVPVNGHPGPDYGKYRTCRAFGIETTLIYRASAHDFAVLRAPLAPGFYAIISCDGITPGEGYLALGYADGGAPDVEPLVGTRERSAGLQMLRGNIYPGMSGGAVINKAGAVVAIINAKNKTHPYAWATPLSETYLCGAPA
jgi:hypothetical protein